MSFFEFQTLHDFGEVDFERDWKSLSNSLREIHTKNASKLSFEELYRNAYKLVLKKKGEPLYNRVKDFEQDWLAHEVRPRILDDLPPSLLAAYNGTQLTVNERRVAGEKLLRSLKSAWEDHNLCMNMTTDVLMYMVSILAKGGSVPALRILLTILHLRIESTVPTTENHQSSPLPWGNFETTSLEHQCLSVSR